jgi:hypothetical protein
MLSCSRLHLANMDGYSGEGMLQLQSSRIIAPTMNSVMMVLFPCSCGAQIEVPLPKLRQPYRDREWSASDFPSIVLLCPFCKHLERQGMESFLRAWVASSPDLPDWHSGDAWIGCGVEGCEAPLPLVYSWNASTPVEVREADIRIWKWDRLRCRNRHAVQKPKDWP